MRKTGSVGKQTDGGSVLNFEDERLKMQTQIAGQAVHGLKGGQLPFRINTDDNMPSSILTQFEDREALASSQNQV